MLGITWYSGIPKNSRKLEISGIPEHEVLHIPSIISSLFQKFVRINISHWNPPKGPQGKIWCNLPNPNIKTASLSLCFVFRKQKNDIIVTTILWPIFVQPKLVNHSSTMTRALNGATWAKSSELRKQKCGRRIIFLERVCKKECRPGKGITVYDGLAANDLKTRQLQQRSYDRPPSFSPSEDVNCLFSSSCFLFHFLKFFSFFLHNISEKDLPHYLWVFILEIVRFDRYLGASRPGPPCQRRNAFPWLSLTLSFLIHHNSEAPNYQISRSAWWWWWM